MKKGTYIVFEVKNRSFARILFFPEGSTGWDDRVEMCVFKRSFGGKVSLNQTGNIIIYESHETDGKTKKIVIDGWDHK